VDFFLARIVDTPDTGRSVVLILCCHVAVAKELPANEFVAESYVYIVTRRLCSLFYEIEAAVCPYNKC
jgi:hypothetical protein